MNKQEFNVAAKKQAIITGELVQASQTPVGDIVAKGKAWWNSKTVITSIIGVLTMVAAMFGYDISDIIPNTMETADKVAGHADVIYVAGTAIVGFVITWWARIKAVFKIK